MEMVGIGWIELGIPRDRSGNVGIWLGYLVDQIDSVQVVGERGCGVVEEFRGDPFDGAGDAGALEWAWRCGGNARPKVRQHHRRQRLFSAIGCDVQ